MTDPKRLDLARIRDRDETALREMFEVLFPLVRMWTRYGAYSRLGSLDEEEDLAQEAILKIYTHLDKAPLDDQNSFLAYCRSVTRNLVINSLRKERRRDLECERFEMEVARQQPPLEHLKELTASLSEELSPDDRQLLEERLAGKTLAEIAEARGADRRFIYRRYSRIVDGLRRRFKSEIGKDL